MPCLDTSVVIDFLLGDEKVVRKLKQLKDEGEHLSTTVITLYELIRDANKEKIAIIDGFLDDIDIYDCDLPSMRKAAEIHNDLKLKGSMVNEFDILIAGISASNNEQILTRDSDFNRMDGIKVQML